MPVSRKLSIVEEAIADLDAYADALEAGGPSEALRRHTARRVKLPLPSVVSAEQVIQARESLGASQTVFARFLGVSPAAVRAWEQRTRVPAGAAGRLLHEIVAMPEYWRKRFAVLAGKAASAADEPKIEQPRRRVAARS